MKTMSKAGMLLVMGALCSAPTWVQADDEPAPEPAPEDATYTFEWSKIDLHVKVHDAIGSDHWADDCAAAIKQLTDQDIVAHTDDAGQTADAGQTPDADEPQDTVKLSVFIGKDDDDDDNDGIPDDQDKDLYGDGVEDDKQGFEEINLDEEAPEAMKELPNDNKTEGIYIAIEPEDSPAIVLKSQADSFEEAAGEVASTLRHKSLFAWRQASFTPSADGARAPRLAANAGPQIDKAADKAYCTTLYGFCEMMLKDEWTVTTNDYGTAKNLQEVKQRGFSRCKANDVACEVKSYNFMVREYNSQLKYCAPSLRHKEVNAQRFLVLKAAAAARAKAYEAAQKGTHKAKQLISLVIKKKK